MIQNLAYCALVEEQLAWSFTQGSKFGEWSLQTPIAHGSWTRSLQFNKLGFESRRIGITTDAAAAPDAACATSVIRLCVEGSHQGLSIHHDRMRHSHACFRESVAIPHASEQTRILPGTGSVGVASAE